jgi:hypothetical protein
LGNQVIVQSGVQQANQTNVQDQKRNATYTSPLNSANNIGSFSKGKALFRPFISGWDALGFVLMASALQQAVLWCLAGVMVERHGKCWKQTT